MFVFLLISLTLAISAFSFYCFRANVLFKKKKRRVEEVEMGPAISLYKTIIKEVLSPLTATMNSFTHLVTKFIATSP